MNTQATLNHHPITLAMLEHTESDASFNDLIRAASVDDGAQAIVAGIDELHAVGCTVAAKRGKGYRFSPDGTPEQSAAYRVVQGAVMAFRRAHDKHLKYRVTDDGTAYEVVDIVEKDEADSDPVAALARLIKKYDGDKRLIAAIKAAAAAV